MIIDIVTLFPKVIEPYFSESIMKRAQEKNIVDINVHNLRKYSVGNNNQVDDKPYGGGAGMVIMIEPVHKALKDLKTEKSLVIATTAKGMTYKQSTAKKLSNESHLILLCGHYEGFDQRILDELVDMNISIGNFVLTGGEIASMVIADSIVRLLPGSLGNEQSTNSDSFYEDDKSVQYPVFTRPDEYEIDGKILNVPDILLSGHHKKIEEWKKSKVSKA